MLEFSTLKEHKANKEHKCALCDGKIQPGETYIRYSGKYEGKMFDYKYHELCMNILYGYWLHSSDSEYSEDEVIEWICETICADCKHGSHEDDDCSIPIFKCEEIIRRFTKEANHENH